VFSFQNCNHLLHQQQIFKNSNDQNFIQNLLSDIPHQPSPTLYTESVINNTNPPLDSVKFQKLCESVTVSINDMINRLQTMKSALEKERDTLTKFSENSSTPTPSLATVAEDTRNMITLLKNLFSVLKSIEVPSTLLITDKQESAQ